MIQFSLNCDNDHRFDSWFRSADAFDTLLAQGMVTCSVCGSAKVHKAVMAPRVATGRDRALSTPESPEEKAISEFRRKIEENSEYVGAEFAKEARKIHEGEAEARQIHGEAKLEEARQMLEDGVPVMPLPFLPNRKAN